MTASSTGEHYLPSASLPAAPDAGGRCHRHDLFLIVRLSRAPESKA
jgi:hypothetical protein